MRSSNFVLKKCDTKKRQFHLIYSISIFPAKFFYKNTFYDDFCFVSGNFLGEKKVTEFNRNKN